MSKMPFGYGAERPSVIRDRLFAMLSSLPIGERIAIMDRVDDLIEAEKNTDSQKEG